MASAGLIGINFASPRSYNCYFPYLNYWQLGDGIEVRVSGVDYSTDYPLGHAQSAWPYLDSKGYLLNPIPAGVTRYRRIWHGVSGVNTPAGYTIAGVKFAVKYAGSADSTAMTQGTQDSSAAGRAVFTATSNAINYVEFNVTAGNVPPTNIRIVPLDYETQWDAGQKFHPEWAAAIKDRSGCIRFVGWQNHYYGWRTTTFAELPAVDHCYLLNAGSAGSPSGAPPSLLTDLANQVQSHPWIEIPWGFGSKVSEVWNITSANPAVVTTYPNPWVADDTFYPIWNTGGTDWNAPWSNTAQTAVSVSGNGVTTDFDASANDAFVVASVKALLISPLNLTNMTTEATPFFEHFRDNLNAVLTPHFELANEPFNILWRSKEFFGMHGRILYPGTEEQVFNNGLKAYGYIAAHFLKVCRDVFGAANRRKWKGIVAGHTANPPQAGVILSGVQDYITNNAPTLTVNDLVDYYACTGYWYGPHNVTRKADLVALANESVSRNGINPATYPTVYSYYDQVVNEERLDGRHWSSANNLMSVIDTTWPAIQAQIASYPGVDLIMYEGGNHDEASLSGLKASFGVGEEDDRDMVMDHLIHSYYSAADNANHETMYQAFIDIGGKFPNKFVDAGKTSEGNPWGAWQYVGAGALPESPIMETLKTFNADTALRARKAVTCTP